MGSPGALSSLVLVVMTYLLVLGLLGLASIFTVTCFQICKLVVLVVGKVFLSIMGFSERSDVPSTTLLELGDKERLGITEGQNCSKNLCSHYSLSSYS